MQGAWLFITREISVDLTMEEESVYAFYSRSRYVDVSRVATHSNKIPAAHMRNTLAWE